MDDRTKIRIAEQFDMWCDECQLYAIKIFIWNTEKEQLEKVIADSFMTLPGKVSSKDWPSAIRASLGKLPHCWLRDIGMQVSILLETPCETDECKEECAKYGSKK